MSKAIHINVQVLVWKCGYRLSFFLDKCLGVKLMDYMECVTF